MKGHWQLPKLLPTEHTVSKLQLAYCSALHVINFAFKGTHNLTINANVSE